MLSFRIFTSDLFQINSRNQLQIWEKSDRLSHESIQEFA